ncbi:hypothetical protein EGR_08587 [Echinococcus granulosus]|uniref:Uncharacterized protein n=1 Tax=Echinococcus granulosus TaxID=6210 RepID=W6U869_ECHGR|nr:hypothetical protein EGR_08587 [Echinococcus granulosus]EUB56561.1 hypothetical protein EGR_08587 [Echinococcus granulosus]
MSGSLEPSRRATSKMVTIVDLDGATGPIAMQCKWKQRELEVQIQRSTLHPNFHQEVEDSCTYGGANRLNQGCKSTSLSKTPPRENLFAPRLGPLHCNHRWSGWRMIPLAFQFQPKLMGQLSSLLGPWTSAQRQVGCGGAVGFPHIFVGCTHLSLFPHFYPTLSPSIIVVSLSCRQSQSYSKYEEEEEEREEFSYSVVTFTDNNHFVISSLSTSTTVRHPIPVWPDIVTIIPHLIELNNGMCDVGNRRHYLNDGDLRRIPPHACEKFSRHR